MHSKNLSFWTLSAYGLPIFAILNLFSISVYAEDPTSTASAEQLSHSLADKMVVTYFGIYNGPSAGNPGAYIPNQDGTLSSTKQYFDNTFYAGYKLSKTISIGPAVEFFWQPVAGQSLNLQDPYIKLANTKVYSKGNYTFAASVRAFIPVTVQGEIAGFRADQIQSYVTAGERLTLGTFSFILGRDYNSSFAPGALNGEIYFAPFAQYRLINKLSATMWTELLQFQHFENTKSLSDSTMHPSISSSGLRTNFCQNFSLMPLSGVFPGKPDSALFDYRGDH